MAKKPTTNEKRKAPPRRRPGRKTRPKNQRATSAERIVREHVKVMAGQYKLQGFSTTQITEAINAHFGPEGEGTTENPVLAAAFNKKHPKGVSRHHVHDLIVEAIAEGAEQLDKVQLLELATQQMTAVMTAMLGPAMQGSVPHASQWQSLLRDFAKLTRLIESDDEKAASVLTQIFLNGNLASC